MNSTATDVDTAIRFVFDVADAIRDAGDVSNGTLYALMFSGLSYSSYRRTIALLKQSGLVEETDHRLRWVGPPKGVMMEDREITQRVAFINALRDVAHFLETHPAVDVPQYTQFNVWLYTREKMAEQARAASWQKEFSGDYAMLKRQFGGGVSFEVNIERDKVCRRVVVGTETIPAQPAREVEKVEWVCEEALLEA